MRGKLREGRRERESEGGRKREREREGGRREWERERETGGRQGERFCSQVFPFFGAIAGDESRAAAGGTTPIIDDIIMRLCDIC